MKLNSFKGSIVIFISLLLSNNSCLVSKGKKTAAGSIDRETLFQVSTMQSLLAGAFEGEKTFGELRKRGNFGIGVVNGLAGEMIALDGKFYLANEEGKVSPVSDLKKTPFAVVTFFEADDGISIENGPSGFASIRNSLDALMTDKNIFYAIKIEGEFESIRIRSTPEQIKPYRKLLEVLKRDQRIFRIKKVSGTMVGFWFPPYLGGLNVSRYHFHFVNRSRNRGGHVLDCSLLKGKIEIDLTPKINIELLGTKDKD